MPLAEPTGGAGRGTLAKSIANLRSRYAGIDSTPGPPQERGVATRTLSDDWLKEWLGQHPEHVPLAGTVLGGQIPNMDGTLPGGTGGGGGGGGGAGASHWDAQGWNTDNPLLGQNDQSAPPAGVTIGRPPPGTPPEQLKNYAIFDGWGKVWRRDWDPNRPGLIKGET